MTITATTTKLCKDCRKQIDAKATVCGLCAEPQTFYMRHSTALNILLAAALVLVSYLEYISLQAIKRADEQRELLVTFALKTAGHDIVQSSVDVYAKGLKTVKDQFAVGEMTRTDVANMEAAFRRADRSRRLYEDDIRRTVAKLPKGWQSELSKFGGLDR